MDKEILYYCIKVASFTAIFLYGIFFLFDKPIGKIKKNLKYTLRLFGFAFVLWSIYVLFGWDYEPMTDERMLDLSAAFISRYSLYALMIDVQFKGLLDHTYPLMKKLKDRVLMWLLFSIAIAFNTYFIDGLANKILLIFFALLFAVQITVIIISFFKRYKAIKRNSDNYHSEDIEPFIKWILKCLYCLYFVGFASLCMPFLPYNYYALFLVFIAVLASTIAYCLHKYSIDVVLNASLLAPDLEELDEIDLSIDKNNITVIDNLVPVQEVNLGASNKPIETTTIQHNETIDAIEYNDADDTTITDRGILSNSAYMVLEKNIDLWLEKEGYTELGLTIQTLAVKLRTNRTYISSYINTKYNQTFRDWISELRIEHAKRLLVSHPHIPTKKIAEMVGYAAGSFNSAFIKANDMSPYQWRKNNIQI